MIVDLWIVIIDLVGKKRWWEEKAIEKEREGVKFCNGKIVMGATV